MLALPSSSALAEDTIKIGLIAPFCGPFAEYGKWVGSGIKTYIKQHGNRVAGMKIELILRDCTGPGLDAEAAFKSAQENLGGV
jgi:branched-chain amino acid transport system substrate-binding protein